MTQRIRNLVVPFHLGPGTTPHGLTECQAQIARRLGDHIQLIGQLRQITRLAVILGQGVTRQLEDLSRADRGTEKVARDLGQLVGLIDDEGIRTRQQFAEAVVPDREIGAQQVMIDHHDIGLLRAPPGLDQMTLAPGAAVLAQAVVCVGGDLWPDGGILGDIHQLADIAPLGQSRPVAHLRQPAQVLAAVAAIIQQRGLHTVDAKIIGTPLEQGDLHRTGHRLAQARQVAQNN